MPAKNALDTVLSAASEEITKAPKDVQKAVTKSNRAVAEAQKMVLENAQQLKAEKKRPVTLAPMYQAYFGETMTVTLNGLSIYVPVNGRTYQVPKSYAQIIQERRRRVDEHILRAQRLSNVQSNFERTAGELVLIPR